MGQEPAETSVHLPQGQDGQWRMAQIKEILVLVTSELCSRKGSHPILWSLDSPGILVRWPHLFTPMPCLPFPHVLEYSFLKTPSWVPERGPGKASFLG